MFPSNIMLLYPLTFLLPAYIYACIRSLSQWVDNKHGPMYGPFLESQGKNNVTVQEWKSGQQFEGEWCGESYTEQRVVSFNFMKQTIGQTLVEVKHTQQFRRVGDDQIIVQIKMEMKGMDILVA